ncbi:MAG: elongation factor P [Bdellovibrionales bacterium]|nr:elongation factor P [Bdellovibrionales bacterium]
MLDTSDFRKNAKLMIDGQPYVITDFQHVKPGKGNQFTRTKLRNLITGQNLERTFKSGEKFDIPDISSKNVQYLYKDDNGLHFMDQTNYESIQINPDDVPDATNFLLENLEVSVVFYNERAIGIDFPNSVNLKVIETAPSFKGNTVTGASKPAKLETGYTVQVPMHIKEGDVLKVDTRTGDYIGRVND